MSIRRFVPTVAGAAAGLALAVAFCVPAAAHVTVSPSQGTRGGYATLTFRVPNESTTAATTRLELTLPADHPVPAVTIRPAAGWTATVTRVKLPAPVRTSDGEITEAVGTVVWTASGPGIGSGEYQLFELQAGPLPDTDRLVLPVLQTYADGTVVRWADPPAPRGGKGPDHPAPVVQLTAGNGAAGDGHDHEDGAHIDAQVDARPDTTGGIALAVAVGALVIAVAALLLVLLRRTSSN